MLKMIACMNNNGVIGKDNTLLWHDKNDLKYFKKMTLNKAVIMGRKTALSLPKFPLPKRLNIVLTKTPQNENEVSSIEEAWELCKKHGHEELWIIGGETLYNQFLHITDELYLTSMLDDQEGDTYFPYEDISKYFYSSELLEEYGNTFMLKYIKKPNYHKHD